MRNIHSLFINYKFHSAFIDLDGCAAQNRVEFERKAYMQNELSEGDRIHWVVTLTHYESPTVIFQAKKQYPVASPCLPDTIRPGKKRAKKFPTKFVTAEDKAEFKRENEISLREIRSTSYIESARVRFRGDKVYLTVRVTQWGLGTSAPLQQLVKGYFPKAQSTSAGPYEATYRLNP